MRRNLGAWGLAVVLLTACGTTTAAEPSDAPCGAPTSTQAAPSGEEILEVDVDERVVADTLDDLAGESEIVVLGRVLRAQDAAGMLKLGDRGFLAEAEKRMGGFLGALSVPSVTRSPPKRPTSAAGTPSRAAASISVSASAAGQASR